MNVALEYLGDLGRQIVELVLGMAAFLFTNESAPGWISLGLVVVLGVLWMWHHVSASRLRGAVDAVRTILEVERGHITTERLIRINAGFRTLRVQRNKGPKHRLAVAWAEFMETSILPETTSDQLSNTVRPAAFFGREELGLDRGMWRQIPAMFVSVGLFLTFLGLVAALDQTGRILDGATAGGDGAATDGLKTLLRIAGTKFIMSLTGLLCSIIFTLVLRLYARRMDDALHALCDDIEKCCIFLSQQTILGKILEQAREQTDHLKSFSTELVAQVATPLREELPNTIREAMQQAMVPVVENISRGTSQGVENLVGSVSGQLIEGVRDSVSLMNGAIGEARTSLEAVVDRLDRSANAISARVEEVTAAADASGRGIQLAGQEMVSSIAAATATMRDSLLDPMGALLERIRDLTSGVETATGRVREYAESVESSATAITSANEGLDRSAASLVAASTPIRDAVGGIASATRTMGDRVEAASEAIHQTTEHTEAVVRGTREAIEASRAAMVGAAGSLGRAVTEFGEVLNRYREIDESLGDAFGKIETAVQSSIDEIATFQRKLNDELGLALNRLEAVIAQAEPFTPRRNR